ncbi:MAG: phage portal protein [Pseudomonadota bacterium]
MNVLGLEIARRPAEGPIVLGLSGKSAGLDLVTHIPPSRVGWWPVIREGFSGAWQRSIVASAEEAATHPTLFACATLIAGDVSKCRPRLMQLSAADDISEEVDVAAYSPVIARPNHYQNRIQFYAYWILSKIFRGNAYALKERDKRGVITALYLLDPTRVRPMVTSSGEVYYALGQDVLAGVTEASTMVPAREIIHDSWNCLYHPLVGLSPIYASGHAALQALTIVGNATRLFRRGLNIGGIVTAPGEISDDNASKLEKYWETNYAGEENAGKVAVLGGGLKFEKSVVMSAVDAQMIDQLKWDDEKVCATLHVPPYMAAVGQLPSYNNVEALGQQYYGQCLQVLFESLELCLTEGLELKAGYEVEFDVAALDRMDSVQRMEVATKGVAGGVLTPNEGRRRFNLRKVPGGEKVYLQKQCWPLEDLGSDSQVSPVAVHVPGQPAPAAAEPPKPADKPLDGKALLAEVLKGLEAVA